MADLYNVKTRQVENIADPQALQQALVSGSHSFAAGSMVPVYSPSGERMVMPAENVNAAIQQGWRAMTPGDQALSDYLSQNEGIKGALKVGVGQAVNQLGLGIPQTIAEHTADPFEVAKWEALKKEHEVANLAGGAAGFIGSMATGAPLFEGASRAGAAVTDAVASRIGAAAAEAAPEAAAATTTAAANTGTAASEAAGEALGEGGGGAAVAEAAPDVATAPVTTAPAKVGVRSAKAAARQIVANMVAKGAGSAVEGAIIASPQALTETALGDPDQAAETILGGVGIGAALGGGGELAKEFLGLGTKLVNKGFKNIGSDLTSQSLTAKALSVALGAPADTIQYYADNADRIDQMSGRDVADLAQEIEADAQPHLADVETTKQALADSTQARDQAVAAGRAADQAQAANPPVDVAQGIVDKLNENRAVQGSLSEKADDALERSNVMIPRADLLAPIDRALKKIGVGARGGLSDEEIEEIVNQHNLENDANLDPHDPKVFKNFENSGVVFGEANKAAAARLQALRNDVASLPEQVLPKEARRIVQGLRNDIAGSYNRGAGVFDDVYARHLKNVVEPISDRLKEDSPEYKAYMNRMSTLAKTAEPIQKLFKTPERGWATLKQLGTPRGKFLEQKLADFGAANGRNYLAALQPYVDAKGRLAIKDASELQRIHAPALSAQVDKLSADLAQKQQDVSRFARLGNITNAQNAVQNLGRKTPSIANVRMLEALGEKTGKDYLQQLKDFHTLQAFNKSATNGSRRVNLMAILGYAAGGTTGAALGAELGATSDLFGPRLVKWAMNLDRNVSGLLFAEKAMKRTAEKLDSIPNVLESLGSRASAEPKISKRTVTNAALFQMLGPKATSDGDKTATLQKLNDKMAEFTNPAAGEGLAGLSMPLTNGGAPNIGSSFQLKLSNGLQYLQQAMPKPTRPPNPFAPKVAWKPSYHDMSVFEQKLDVLHDPMVVLDHLRDGTLTQNHVDALQAVYPKLLDQIRQRVINASIAGRAKPMPYTARMKLSMLMGSPIDPSLSGDSIGFFQQTYAPQQAAQGPQGGMGGQKIALKGDMAAAYQSNSQRLESRKS